MKMDADWHDNHLVKMQNTTCYGNDKLLRHYIHVLLYYLHHKGRFYIIGLSQMSALVSLVSVEIGCDTLGMIMGTWRQRRWLIVYRILNQWRRIRMSETTESRIGWGTCKYASGTMQGLEYWISWLNNGDQQWNCRQWSTKAATTCFSFCHPHYRLEIWDLVPHIHDYWPAFPLIQADSPSSPWHYLQSSMPGVWHNIISTNGCHIAYNKSVTNDELQELNDHMLFVCTRLISITWRHDYGPSSWRTSAAWYRYKRFFLCCFQRTR